MVNAILNPPDGISEPSVQILNAMDETIAAVADMLAFDQDGSIAHQMRRRKILSSAAKLLQAAKDPEDQWQDGYINGGQAGAIRIFYEWGVFNKIPLQGGITFEELAKEVKAEVSLVRRLAGMLVATGMLEQLGADQIAHTPRSLPFVGDNPTGYMYEISSHNLVTLAHTPHFFEKYGRKEPESLAPVPASFAYGCPELNFYELLAKDPPRMKRFIKSKEAAERFLPTSGLYDFRAVVEKAQVEKERAVLVDVGGGNGHCLATILREYPNIPQERCVLQDRNEVLKAAEDVNDPALSAVKKVPIDFHHEQPVKGAITYWIRRCIHNYNDTHAANILRILAEAMREDSRLLIVDEVKGNPPSVEAAAMDILMLGVGGKERTQEEWERLTEKAGLQIISIGPALGSWGQVAAIECVKA